MREGKQGDEAAREIYQDLLDRIAQSYWDNDFEALTQMIHVPHKVSSFGPIVPIETRADLRHLFGSIRAYLLKMQVTHYHRVCLAAQFNADDEIEGTHETRLLNGTNLIEDPYPVKSVLRLIQDQWRVCESDNAVEPDRGFGRIFNEQNAHKADELSRQAGQDSDKGTSAND